jgi:hypothetical protein
MKTILLWDPRFPDRKPARLTLADALASAAVRAGVAAAADPADQGALATGGALDPGLLTEVVVEHGYRQQLARVVLPYAVVLIGAGLGVLASVGSPVAGVATPPIASGNAAMLAALASKSGPVNVGVLGSSKMRQHAIVPAKAARSMPSGPLTIAQTRTRRWRLNFWFDTINPTFDSGNNGMSGHIFAGDGQTFGNMYQRIPMILASRADVIVVQRTANSVQIDNTDIYGNLLGTPFSGEGYNALERLVLNAIITGMGGRFAGKPVIVEELIPRRTDAGSLPPQFAAGAPARAQIPACNSLGNEWCAANGIPVIHNYDVVVPASDPNGNPELMYLRADRIHRSLAGAFAESFTWQNVIDPLCPVIGDPDPLAAGNLVINPRMSGAGPIATGYTRTRHGSTGTGTPSIVTVDGKPWQQISTDLTTVADGVQEADTFVVPLNATAGSGWARARFRVHVEASASWYGTPTMIASAGPEPATTIAGMDGGGSGVTDPTSLSIEPGIPVANGGLYETPPFRVSLTAGSLSIRGPSFRRGVGMATWRFTDVEFVPVADPRSLMYDASLPLGTTISGGASAAYSFVGDGVTARSLTFLASKPGTWSIGGADAALWTIDQWGLAKRAGPLNFGAPDDTDADGVDSFTVTLTPFDIRDAAVSQAVTVTATFAYTGFSDRMNQAAGDITTNPGWTAMPGYVAGAIAYTGANNFAIGYSNVSGGGVFAPQQGDTVEQRVTAEQRFSVTNNGTVAVLALDAANWLGLTNVLTTGIQFRTSQAGTLMVLGTFTPDLPPAQGDVLSFQVREQGAGVYKLEVYQNGVRLVLGSGTDDVTNFVTGAGFLATARRSGLITRTGGLSIWLRNWNNITASARTTLRSVKPLVWKTPNATTIAVAAGGGAGAADIDRRTAGSTISLGTVTKPAGNAAEFLADGDTIRWSGSLVAGTYTVNVIETLDGAVKSPRTTALTITVA